MTRGAAPALAAALALLALYGCGGPHRPPEIPRPPTPPSPPARAELRGIASWYGPGFHGNRTANGEVYDMHAMTAAHKTLPFDTVVEVHNLDNGQSVRVRINDRGPFIPGRIIDLSKKAAREIGMIGPGTARVRLEILSEAPPPVRRAQEAAAGEGRYVIQVGAFRERQRAEVLAARLDRRYDAVRLESSGGWHRVLLGPYADAERTAAIAAELAADGLDTYVRQP